MAAQGTTRNLVVKAVDEYWKHNGYGPSMTELCFVLGKSHTAIRFHVVRLIEDGVLTKQPGKMRSIRVVK